MTFSPSAGPAEGISFPLPSPFFDPLFPFSSLCREKDGEGRRIERFFAISFSFHSPGAHYIMCLQR